MMAFNLTSNWTGVVLTANFGAGTASFSPTAARSAVDVLDQFATWLAHGYSWLPVALDDGVAFTLAGSSSAVITANVTARTLLGFVATHTGTSYAGASAMFGTVSAHSGASLLRGMDATLTESNVAGAGGALRSGVPGTACEVESVKFPTTARGAARVQHSLALASHPRMVKVYDAGNWQSFVVRNATTASVGASIWTVDCDLATTR